MKRLVLPLMTAAALWFAACGDESSSDDDGLDTSGAGGSAGAGGQAGIPAGKPVCLTPDEPLSGTPSVRADAASALSEDGLTLVMFGGDVANVICPNIPPKEPVAETWLLDTSCGQWTQLSIAGPSARSRHSMVSDHARARALSFGGRWRPDPTGGSYTLYNDVWSFDFASQSWSELTTTGTPPEPRYNASVVVTASELVVFGGGTATSATSFDPVGTVFALNLETNEWRQIQTQDASPPPRLFHSAAYDSANNRMFIGYGSDNSAFVTTDFFQDQWVLDLDTASWHELDIAEPLEVPYGRIKGAMFFRPSADGAEPHRLYQVAGHDDGDLGSDPKSLGNRNDVLAVDIPVGVASEALGPLSFELVLSGDVRQKDPHGNCDFPADFVAYDFESPERRSAFAFSPAYGGEGFVIFAGDSDCDRLSDAWWFDTRAGSWDEIRESLPGLTCPRTNGGDIGACNGMCG